MEFSPTARPTYTADEQDSANSENGQAATDFAPGKHLILDYWGAKHLTDQAFIQASLEEAAHAASATILHSHLHVFEGGGITGVLLLAESHISVHTWPELEYVAFDIFMCGGSHPEKAVKVLEKQFRPTKKKVSTLNRG